MKILGNIIKYIIVATLMLSIIVAVILNIASSTILSKSYILQKLDDTGYYSQMYLKIHSNFENYIGQSGLNEEVFENILTETKVKEDTNKIIENIYEGKSEEISTKEIETNLNLNIQKYLNEKKLTATQEKAINEYVKKICDEYTTTMVHTSYENKIYDVYSKAMKSIEFIKKAIIGLITVLIFILVMLNIKTFIRSIAQIGIALTTSGLFYLIIDNIINLKIKVSNIVILNDAFSITIRTIAEDILTKFLNLGTVLLMSGIVIIVIANIFGNLKNNKKNKEDKE